MSRIGPVGVFDSGVGGLTVVAELVRQLPSEDLVYFGDTARVPYGIRSPRVIQEFSLEIGSWLVSQGVKAIVVACNTASSVALEVLRDRLPVPVLGVVEAGARMAVAATRNRRIGVIGTRSTIGSRAYAEAISRLDDKAQSWSRACPLFVPMVEESLFAGDVAETVIHHYLDDLAAQGVDTLVLGCTHYPLLLDSIRRVIGESVVIIDAARGTARELRDLLNAQELSSPQLQAGRHRFVFSDRTEAFQALARQILPDFKGDMELLSVESEAFRSAATNL